MSRCRPLTVQQAADRLGIERETLYRMLKRREISHLRFPSGMIRVWVEHIEEYEARIAQPMQEMPKAPPKPKPRPRSKP